MALLFEELSYATIGAAMEVHKQLKSGDQLSGDNWISLGTADQFR